MMLRLAVAAALTVTAFADSPQASDPAQPEVAPASTHRDSGRAIEREPAPEAATPAQSADQSNLEQHFGTDRQHLAAGEVVSSVPGLPPSGPGRSNLEQHLGTDFRRLGAGQGVARLGTSFGPDQDNFDQHFGTDRFQSEDVGSAGGEPRAR